MYKSNIQSLQKELKCEPNHNFNLPIFEEHLFFFILEI